MKVTRTIIVFPKIGNHPIAHDPAHIRIVQTCLQSITGCNKGLSSTVANLRFNEDYRSVILAFLTHAPLFAQSKCIIGNGISIQIIHGNHIDLSGGGIVISTKFLFQCLRFFRREKARKIVYHARRIHRFRYILSINCSYTEQQKE
jgi:hypothetical protein